MNISFIMILSGTLQLYIYMQLLSLTEIIQITSIGFNILMCL